MKSYKILFLGLMALGISSCTKGLEEDLSDANVMVEGSDVSVGGVMTVKKGSPVKFNIVGEPDNVTFFSGELGHEFQYAKRTQIDPSEILSSKMSFRLETQYSSTAANTNLVSMYLSDQFPGLDKSDFDADCKLLNEFKWDVWVPEDELPNKAGFKRDYEMDMMPYMGKNLTLAVNYHGQLADQVQPKLHIRNFKITSQLKNGSEVELMAGDMGLTAVNESYRENELDVVNIKKNGGFADSKGQLIDSKLQYGTVTNNCWGMWNLKDAGKGYVFIHSTTANKGLRRSWLVSNALMLNACSPDSGEAIKSLPNRLESYEYTYSEAGEYEATFVMNNANYKHEARKVVTLKIKVTD